MAKYKLLQNGAVISRYETKELKLNKRVKETITTDGIVLPKGTFSLIIDDDAKISQAELRNFADKYFENGDLVFKRLNAIINPTQSYKTIF